MNATTERFWAKVDKSGQCWLWTACKLPAGYGRFGVAGQVELAHRYSYRLAHGSIPKGFHVDHTCHQPSCVRPDHLRAITPKQNIENRCGANKNSRTGVRGVYQEGARFRVVVKHNRQNVNIGLFDTLEEASIAAREARLRLFTHSDMDSLGGVK